MNKTNKQWLDTQKQIINLLIELSQNNGSRPAALFSISDDDMKGPVFHMYKTVQDALKKGVPADKVFMSNRNMLEWYIDIYTDEYRPEGSLSNLIEKLKKVRKEKDINEFKSRVTTLQGDNVIEEARKISDPSTYAYGHIFSSTDDIYESLLSSLAEKGRYIKTGFPRVDMLVGGVNKGSLTTIAACSGVGKSSFASEIFRYNIFVEKTPTLFFTLEMSTNELLKKVISAHSGIQYTKIIRYSEIIDKAEKGDKEALDIHLKVNKGAQSIQKLDTKFDVIDKAKMPGMDLDKIILAIRDFAYREGGLSLVIIDYLQIIPISKGNLDRTARVTHITERLKEVAQELDIAIISLAQINRVGAELTMENGTFLDIQTNTNIRYRYRDIKDYHIADSSSIGRDSDNLWILDRDHMSKEDNASLNIIKVRQPVTAWMGRIPLASNQTTLTYEDVKPPQSRVMNFR